MLLLALFLSAAALAGGDVTLVPVISSLDYCKRLGGAEPAAILEFKKAPISPPEANPVRMERRRIYSDLCMISEQPVARIVIDAKGEIVGIGLANTFEADSLLTFSSYWKP